MRDADDVTTIELKVAESTVGRLRMRASERPVDASLLRLVTTLIASEVERVRAPERASEEAADAFHARRSRGADRGSRGSDRARQGARDRSRWRRASVVIIRAHPRNPTEEDWRRRLLALAARGARSIAPGAIAAPTVDEAAEIAVLLPDGDGEVGRRVGVGGAARARVGAARVRVRDRPQPARPRIRSSCTARATRRCSRRTSSRASPSGSSSATRRPGPTSCCCRT